MPDTGYGYYQYPDNWVDEAKESLQWWWEIIKLPYTALTTPSQSQFELPSGNYTPSVPGSALQWPYQPTQEEIIEAERRRVQGFRLNVTGEGDSKKDLTWLWVAGGVLLLVMVKRR